MIRSIACLVILVTVSGCAAVKPWQREVLARPDMNPDGEPLRAGLDDHTYFSKEAASGGRGFGGGGCGCN